MTKTMGMALTGHRPTKLAGYDLSNPFYGNLYRFLVQGLRYNIERHDRVIAHSGLALGADTVWSKAIMDVRKEVGADTLGFVAHVPCEGQSSKWRRADQAFWQLQCEKADDVIVYAPTYTRTCMQDRNVGMVNAAAQADSSILVAIWDGTPGGTKNCLDYARRPGVIDDVRIFAPSHFSRRNT